LLEQLMIKAQLLLHNQNTNAMKKSLAILALVAMTISACSQYTCPTYSKTPVQKTEKGTRI